MQSINFEFLTQSVDYLKKKYTSEGLEELERDDNGQLILDAHGNQVYHYPGDLLHPYQKHLSNKMFYGFDFNASNSQD